MATSKFFAILAVFALLFGCAASGPQAPNGVAAASVSGGVEITWQPSQAADVTGYNVYRSSATGQKGEKINAALITTLTFTDSNAMDGSTYYYSVASVSAQGAEGPSSAQAGITAQTSPPSGLQLSINGGADYSNSSTVSLSVSGSRASECRFSNDGQAWGDWASYSSTMQWQLSAGDGEKTVYAMCRTSSGIASQQFSAKVQLRTTGPAITVITPQEDDLLPTSFGLTFEISNTIGQASCIAMADGATVPIGAVEEGKQNTVQVLLPDGGHQLYVQCSDEAGTSQSAAARFQTEQNPVSFTINDGSGHTASQQVSLNIHAPGAAQCRFANDGAPAGPWRTFTATQQWSLNKGDGSKSVTVECRNAQNAYLGNATDAITLDTDPPPYVSLVINNGELVTYSAFVRLSTYASTSVTECRYSNDGVSFTAWQAYQQSQWYTLSGGDGTHTVTAQCRDALGTPNTATASITVQTTPQSQPTNLQILINNGASSTSVRNVDLTLSARFADNCRLRNDDGAWSEWQPYQRYMSWVLSSVQGQRLVFFQCNNQFGLSGAAQASITYGSSSPATVSLVTPIDGNVYSDATVDIQFIPNGGVSPFSCSFYCNGAQNDAGSVRAGSMYTKTMLGLLGSSVQCGTPSAGSTFNTYVICTDNSGSLAQTPLVTFQWTHFVGPLKGEGEGLLGAS